MDAKLSDPTQHRRIFLFLVAYRWASLLPVLWLLQPRVNPAGSGIAPELVLAIAAGSTLLITAFHRPLNRLLLGYPSLLAVDMLFVAGLLAVSGGTRSPYYLYALSPLLSGAFFFQMRGALLAAGAFTPLYLLALMVGQQAFLVSPEPQALFTQLAGIWLIAILFGYPSILLQRLGRAHDALTAARDDLARHNVELTAAHRQLKIIHDLTVSLQAAPDVQSVQQQVLRAVTGELGFPRAIIGLVNPISQKLGDWQVYPSNWAPPPAGVPLPLEPESGLIVEWLFDQQLRWCSNQPALTCDEELNAWIGQGPWLLLPLTLREHPVGVLLVATETGPDEWSDDRLAVLNSVGSQAAVALGTIMLCIDRAMRLAVEQERNRIARDIHDTVAQSLFGIVFTLDACIKMLPDQVKIVKRELVELRDLASQVRDEVRRSIFDIWPSELTLERFKDDLRKYAVRHSALGVFCVDFSTDGDFSQLSPVVRRGLYRVAQEALANAAHHAEVDFARICLRVEAGQVYLSVQDHGKGFDPEVALARAHSRGSLGLLGIRERVRALGGECDILSRCNEGTLVLVRVPVNGRYGGV